jgi:hypothetical protein
MPVSNEEAYLTWLKTVSKLKYNQAIKDYLYLPLHEHYQRSDGLSCSAHSQL